MQQKITALILVLISPIFYAGGEYLSKLWSLKPSWLMAILATVCYMIGAVLWLPALRQLSALSAVWSCLSIIVCVIIGTSMFGEILTTRQIIGLILAMIATLLTI